ncbi:MAG: phenylacetate--CoA ligase family protein [Rhodospirillales bacterium]|nr:phenylacetate--CoA ligase family protein [Rhodospirillales bacterium]
MIYPPVPHAEIDGNVWPALPGEKGQIVLSLLYQMDQSQWWSAEDIRTHQFSQLSALLSQAWHQVPFHRARLEQAGLAPPFDQLEQRWAAIPILTRSDIQEQGKALYSAHLPRGHGAVYDIHTSGSTGQPIRALRSQLALWFWSAFTLREHLWHRRDLRGKLAVIRDSTPGVSAYPKGSRYKYWGSSRQTFDTGPCVSLNINASAAEQADWLVRENPDYLLTHPTNILRVAHHCLENKIKIPNLKQINTLSEILRPETRDLCRDAWGVEITDNYSSREIGYMALQCPEHAHYHIQSEGVFLEVVDSQGKPCKPGEIGRILVTHLHNFAMPFIRYDVGDFAEVGEACPCGRGLPVLKQILGREQNMLSKPDGEKVWTLLSEGAIRKLLKLAPIREYQFVQKTQAQIEARFVVDRALSASETSQVRTWLAEKFGPEFEFTLTYLKELPRSKSGKLQDFISEVG